MKWMVVAATAILLSGCGSLPPILQRWADLEIGTSNLIREDTKTNESLYFSEDGRVQVNPGGMEAPRVRWRVQGAWLQIDTNNDGTYKMRLRAVSWTKNRIVAINPTGKRSVWRTEGVVVVIKPLPPRPGLWMP